MGEDFVTEGIERMVTLWRCRAFFQWNGGVVPLVYR